MKNTAFRILVCFLTFRIACAAAEQSPVEKVAADYNKVRSEAIDQVNQKYILLASAEMKLTLKEGDLQKANAINDWAKRLADTDDIHNTRGIAPDPNATDRLGFLQTAYLKERTLAVTVVDKSYETYVDTARQQAMKDGDLDGANAADKLLVTIKTELGAGAAPTTGKPFGVQAGNPGNVAAPANARPAPVQPSTGPGFVPGVGFASSDTNSNSSHFTGTVWTSTSYIGGSHGAIATLTFRADGTWVEDYTPHPMKGHWKITKDPNIAEVKITNDKIGGDSVVHFKMSADGATGARVEDSVAYSIKK